ncbi:hypothetical protein ACFLWI_05860 [Chloroflexota bacterium]
MLAIMNPLTISGDEPQSSVAEAIKAVNYVLQVATRITIGLSEAARKAREQGTIIKQITDVSEDYLNRDFSVDDLNRINERTEAAADKAMVSTPYGTDVTMSLRGQDALALHPLARRGGLPDYPEVAMIGWGYVLREPLRYTVKVGKVVDISGSPEEAKRLKKIASIDEGASNIAELAIGTSHTIAGLILGTRLNAARVGNVHIAIGGNNWSKIHLDNIMTRLTVHLDDACILNDGVLQI